MRRSHLNKLRQIVYFWLIYCTIFRYMKWNFSAAISDASTGEEETRNLISQTFIYFFFAPAWVLCASRRNKSVNLKCVAIVVLSSRDWFEIFEEFIQLLLYHKEALIAIPVNEYLIRNLEMELGNVRNRFLFSLLRLTIWASLACLWSINTA